MNLLEIRKCCLELAIKFVTDPITLTTAEQNYSGGPQSEASWVYLPDFYGNLSPSRVGGNFTPPNIPFDYIMQMAKQLEGYLLGAEQDALNKLGQIARTP